MHGNRARVSQEKSVLLKDNSILTPHNPTYQRLTLVNAIFCNRAINTRIYRAVRLHNLFINHSDTN